MPSLKYQIMTTIHQQYIAALDYLYTQLPMYQRIGAPAFKKGLDNTLALCAHLGNPQHQFPTIHIAGTNGKGTVTHLLGAMLQAQGLKVGYYTSPHYKDFRERIKINGVYISKKAIVAFVAANKSIFEEIKPSFFEMTVALALHHFAQEKVDIAVIEVGLGGRLDSTNIITPLLSVITNISFDHVNMLGDTLPLIAAEKAGIIKPNIPIVIGERDVETESVFIEKAKEQNAMITFASDTYHVAENGYNLTHSNYHIYKNNKSLYDDLQANLHGTYQLKNTATALQAIEIFNQLQQFPEITATHIRAAFANLKAMTRFIGRWHIANAKPLIVMDGGHNEAGIKEAIAQINSLSINHLHIVIGTVNDKDIATMLSLLPKNATYYFCKADIPRGLAAKDLREKGRTFGLQGRTYTTVKNAFRAAKKHALPDDMIFVGGSIFVVGEVI
jgi:dihydrofolate synthase/folylpolyglutamate synthase